MRQDEEYYVRKIANILRDTLNAKIESINAEKGDGIVLSNVDGKAYYFLTFGRDVPLYDPCVILGVEPEESITNGGESLEQLSVTIEMVVSSKLTADSETMFCTLARYRRAIKETLRDARSKLPTHSVVTLPHLAFASESGESFFTLGVGVRFKFVS